MLAQPVAQGKKEELGKIFCPVLLNGKVRTNFHEMNEWQLFEIPQANDDFTLVILQELTLVDFEVGSKGKIAYICTLQQVEETF